MHELSIVMSIVEAAGEEVLKYKAKKVEEIELEIGTLAGVDPHALDFAWEAGVKSTILEHAKRIIHEVKGKARCSECDCEYELKELYDPCPVCGGHFHQIITGKELRIHALTLIN
jgi:hydrogenase nickel incorporation protein HypA/HybF